MESVHDYPRPPRLEPVPQRIRVVFGGVAVADTTRAHRVLETTHPPVYYVPREDVLARAVEASVGGTTFCEWKGSASYFDVVAGGRRAERAAWAYPAPADGFETIRNALAFYCAPMDACFVAEEQATPQPGGFYGGWVTSEIVGPVQGRARDARLVNPGFVYRRAAASASATRSWSSTSIAVKNGSASVRCERSSETGQSPSRKP